MSDDYIEILIKNFMEKLISNKYYFSAAIFHHSKEESAYVVAGAGIYQLSECIKMQIKHVKKKCSRPDYEKFICLIEDTLKTLKCGG